MSLPRSLLTGLSAARSPALPALRLQISGIPQLRSASTTHLPAIAQPSLWKSLIPKFLRRKSAVRQTGQVSTWESWKNNPASFFMLMFILIGSMSINLLGMRNEFTKFNRHMDARLELLKEVIGRLQKGEKFDVERALGAGDEESELEWEKVVNELASNTTIKEKVHKTPERKPEVAKVIENPVETETAVAQLKKKKGISSYF